MAMLTCLLRAAGEPANAFASVQDEAGSPAMSQETFVHNGSSLGYWLYTPADPAENLPLLVYLHGGSGKGNDLNLVISNGFPMYLHDGDLGHLNAFVVIPQLSKELSGWSAIAPTLYALINETAAKYGCDRSRISLTGHSMGGTGTWALAAKYPSLFYRVAPMSGSITQTEANISALEDSEIWAFVGSADNIVDPQSTLDFIQALNSPKAQCTVIEGATHFDVPEVYVSQEYHLAGWLLGQEGATGISPVPSAKEDSEAAYYDLHGRRVENPSRGLYVKNGRVVFVK